MAAMETLIKLITSAEGDFASANRVALEGLVENLSLVLADCDGLGFEVIDALWQGCRFLQDALDDQELCSKKLGAASGKLQQVLRLLGGADESEPVVVSSASEDPGYTIPADDVELIEDFTVEGMEHLEAAEGAMLELEDDLANSDVLNLIFRAFHTIKGMAGFMNLQQIGQLTHNAETLLDLARKGSVVLTDVNADAVYKTIDMLKGMLDALRDAINGDNVVSFYPGVDELSALLQQCVDGTATVPHVESSAEAAEVIEEKVAEAVAVQEVAEAAAEDVPVEAVVEAAAVAEVAVVEVEKPVEVEQDVVAPAPAQASSPGTPAVAAKKAHAHVEESIKVKTSRLDNLINMIGELVIAQLMVSESLKTDGTPRGDKLEHDILHQGKLIRELQELSTSMRMVPISGIFQKMARMSRDLSRQAGKSINFSMQGEQTELDRSIVDKLADPLVHMIRNSVDHGVETPDGRKEAGKAESGEIELRAFHAAGNIVIELEDDGRGLNREKLFEKGVQSGVFAPGSTPSDSDVFNIIFTPGLSTAEKVTKVSGRGVGMDVVKRNIENLRGRIDIKSTPGKGTLFTITLPLTLAIIDGQIISVGDEPFIIPINVIRKSFRPEAKDLSTVQGRGEMVNDRGELLNMVRLHDLFSVEPHSTNPQDGLVVVVEQDNCACGLLVDDLLGQQQVVLKSLGSVLSHTPGISGGAIMGNGQVSLILDIAGIFKISQI